MTVVLLYSQPTVTAESDSDLGARDGGDMPDVEVCLHSTILRFSQNLIILYKFKLGVLTPCNARLTTVRALSHSKQPQYVLSRTILTGLGRCTSITVRRFNYLGQIEATQHTSLPNRIIASCPFEISSTGKKQNLFEVLFLKLNTFHF